MYNPASRLAGGGVWCDAGPATLGAANMNGHLRLGPSAIYTLSSGGFIGDLSWAGSGIEPGWLSYDYRFCLPDATAPFTAGLSLPVPGNGRSQLVSTNYYASGNYSMLNGDVLTADGSNPTLYISGGFNMHAGSTIVITNGASLKLYLGSSVGAANSSVLYTIANVGDSTTFQLYGLPTTTSLAWSANSNFVGVIYAPQATLVLGNGAYYTNDFQGAVVVDSLQFSGHFNFHFDEYLKHRGPTR
jgi:hypothetical protein